MGVAYGSADLHDGGWTIHGGGGAATKTAFNLIGGYVEYDMDVTGSQTGVIQISILCPPVGLVVEDSQMTNPNIVMMVAADLTAWRLIGLRPTETAVVRQPFTHHQALATMVAL